VVGAALFRLFHPKADLQSRNSLSEEEPVRDPCQGAARELVDGHTLGPVITKLEKLTAVETRRIHVDKGYRRVQSPTEVSRVDQRRVGVSGDAPAPRTGEADRGGWVKNRSLAKQPAL
jgi:hypothetical protein